MTINQRVSVKLYVLLLVLSGSIILFGLSNRELISKRWLNDKVAKFSGYENKPVVDIPNREIISAHKNTNTKKILYWTKLWSSSHMDFGEGDIFGSCPVWNCEATSNRSALKVEDFDVVIFHGVEMNPNDLPQRRSPHQLYIFLDLEPQIFHPIPYNKIFENFYNWTMTYRRDSTLMRPYGVVKRIDTTQYIPPHIPAIWKDVSNGVIEDETRQKVQNKSKLVSWFVSNCATSSKREIYVKILKQYIPVDIFGKCGPLKCNKNYENCFEIIEKEYFFYIAFENSLCTDYVTEKAFKFLQYDVVPIVYGAVDYSTVLPPGSYIDIQDFSSPKELADYLLEVSQDPEKYMSFFKWKNYFTVEIRPEYYTICEFCKRLHEVNDQSSVTINNIYDWWANNQCLQKPTFKGIPSY